MSKKNNANPFSSLVYSTNPDAMPEHQEEEVNTLPPSAQKLRVVIDKKQRKGKTVTLVERFEGSTADLETLGKTLKTKCGTGGNVKDGVILIQGDFREKIIACLIEMGYKQTK